MVAINRFLKRFHFLTFLVMFGGLLADLGATVYDAATGRVEALNAEVLIACTLGALLCNHLIGPVNPRRRR